MFVQNLVPGLTDRIRRRTLGFGFTGDLGLVLLRLHPIQLAGLDVLVREAGVEVGFVLHTQDGVANGDLPQIGPAALVQDHVTIFGTEVRGQTDVQQARVRNRVLGLRMEDE